jgi:hypothetical protein
VGDAVRALPEDLDSAKVPGGSLLLLLGAVGALIENGEAELLGEVDASVMVRMAIEMPNYPHEVWSRPAWRWPVAVTEAA